MFAATNCSARSPKRLLSLLRCAKYARLHKLRDCLSLPVCRVASFDLFLSRFQVSFIVCTHEFSVIQITVIVLPLFSLAFKCGRHVIQLLSSVLIPHRPLPLNVRRVTHWQKFKIYPRSLSVSGLMFSPVVHLTIALLPCGLFKYFINSSAPWKWTRSEPEARSPNCECRSSGPSSWFALEDVRLIPDAFSNK